MKNVIIVITTKEISNLSSFTIPAMQKYADAVGATLVVLDESVIDTVKYQHPKYYVFAASEVKGYDRILLLDADIFVKSTAPDIFSTFPDNNKIYAFNEYSIRNNRWKDVYEGRLLRHVLRNGMESVVFPRSKHYNGGVTLYPSGNEWLFPMPTWSVTSPEHTFPPNNSVKQQPWRNYCMVRSGLEVVDIGIKWGHLPNRKVKAGDSYFIHLTACRNWRLGETAKLSYLNKLKDVCGMSVDEQARLMNFVQEYDNAQESKRQVVRRNNYGSFTD